MGGSHRTHLGQELGQVRGVKQLEHHSDGPQTAHVLVLAGEVQVAGEQVGHHVQEVVRQHLAHAALHLRRELRRALLGRPAQPPRLGDVQVAQHGQHPQRGGQHLGVFRAEVPQQRQQNQVHLRALHDAVVGELAREGQAHRSGRVLKHDQQPASDHRRQLPLERGLHAGRGQHVVEGVRVAVDQEALAVLDLQRQQAVFRQARHHLGGGAGAVHLRSRHQLSEQDATHGLGEGRVRAVQHGVHEVLRQRVAGGVLVGVQQRQQHLLHGESRMRRHEVREEALGHQVRELLAEQVEREPVLRVRRGPRPEELAQHPHGVLTNKLKNCGLRASEDSHVAA